jgi:hypothetical protein
MYKVKLSNPEPDLLEEVTRNFFRPDLIINCTFAAPDIGLHGTDEAWSLPDFPDDIEAEEYRNVDVGNEKVLSVEGRNECGEAVEDDNDAEVAEREPGRVWLEARFEDQGVAVNVLGYQG